MPARLPRNQRVAAMYERCAQSQGPMKAFRRVVQMAHRGPKNVKIPPQHYIKGSAHEMAPVVFRDLSHFFQIQGEVKAPAVCDMQDLTPMTVDALMKIDERVLLYKQRARSRIMNKMVIPVFGSLGVQMMFGPEAALVTGLLLLGLQVRQVNRQNRADLAAIRLSFYNQVERRHRDQANPPLALYSHLLETVFVDKTKVIPAQMKEVLAHEFVHVFQHRYWPAEISHPKAEMDWLAEGFAHAASIEFLLNSDRLEDRQQALRSMGDLITRSVLDDYFMGLLISQKAKVDIQHRYQGALLLMALADHYGEGFYSKIMNGDFSPLEQGLAEFMAE